MVGDESRKTPPKRPDIVSALRLAAHLGFVFLPVYLAAVVGPSLWLLPLWLWFGLAMHGVLNLMHEASHFHVFRTRAASDRLGHWLLGPLVASDFESYRQRHWDHHRFVGQANDTKDAYLLDLRGPRFAAFVLRCLLLQEAFEKFRSTRSEGNATREKPSNNSGKNTWMLRTLLVQALFGLSLLATAAAAHGSSGSTMWLNAALAWGAVYAYGMMGLTLCIASLRTLAEHGPGPEGEPGATTTGRARMRNMRCGPVGRFLMGSYGFAEHATHHRYPAIPAYQLPTQTAGLVASGAADFTAHLSYFERLRNSLRGA